MKFKKKKSWISNTWKRIGSMMRRKSYLLNVISETERENGKLSNKLQLLNVPATVRTARSLSTSSVKRDFEIGLSFCPILR